MPHTINLEDTRKQIPDPRVTGDPDSWHLICKVSSNRPMADKSGFMKSTKAMVIPGGCLIQVSTEIQNADGTFVLAEAITFAPNVTVMALGDGSHRIVSL